MARAPTHRRARLACVPSWICSLAVAADGPLDTAGRPGASSVWTCWRSRQRGRAFRPRSDGRAVTLDGDPAAAILDPQPAGNARTHAGGASEIRSRDTTVARGSSSMTPGASRMRPRTHLPGAFTGVTRDPPAQPGPRHRATDRAGAAAMYVYAARWWRSRFTVTLRPDNRTDRASSSAGR
jgi:hypothetical protein